jgi:hypothetical protein
MSNVLVVTNQTLETLCQDLAYDTPSHRDPDTTLNAARSIRYSSAGLVIDLGRASSWLLPLNNTPRTTPAITTAIFHQLLIPTSSADWTYNDDTNNGKDLDSPFTSLLGSKPFTSRQPSQQLV